MGHYWKIWKNLNFSDFGSKTRLTRCLRWLISWFFYYKPQKWLCQELLKGLNLKVTKYELIISNQSEMADNYRVSHRYRTAGKRQPNHLDSFKNDNQDVFWKIQFKTFLVELEFLKNMKKWKSFHIGEKSCFSGWVVRSSGTKRWVNGFILGPRKVV